MMCCGQERRRGFWITRAIFIPVAIAAGVFIFGSILMLLWNALLPAVLGVHTITFWQALGILILSKILFGGFSGGHGHHRHHGYRNGWHGKWMHMSPEERHNWHDKWTNMTPEEREKMKAEWRTEWRSRCEPADKKE